MNYIIICGYVILCVLGGTSGVVGAADVQVLGNSSEKGISLYSPFAVVLAFIYMLHLRRNKDTSYLPHYDMYELTCRLNTTSSPPIWYHVRYSHCTANLVSDILR